MVGSYGWLVWLGSQQQTQRETQRAQQQSSSTHSIYNLGTEAREATHRGKKGSRKSNAAQPAAERDTHTHSTDRERAQQEKQRESKAIDATNNSVFSIQVFSKVKE